MELRTFKYTWKMLDDDVKTILTLVDFSKYTTLVGVATGGMPLLTKLVQATKLDYEIIKCSSYNNTLKKCLTLTDNNSWSGREEVLLIDDVLDTGDTLKTIIKHLQDIGITKIHTLTLCYKPHSIIKPTWYLHEVPSNMWINFPWE